MSRGHQVKTTKTFNCQNLSRTNRLGGELQSVSSFFRFPRRNQCVALGIPQLQMRAAYRTGVRLRMETAVAGIIVFSLALRTHPEAFHRTIRAVVGERFNDAKTRTTIGAVGEWIK